MAPTAKEKQEAAERDNQTQTADEWERVQAGLGEQWDFDKSGDLIGTWVGAEVVELKEPGLDGKSEATAYMFALDDGSQVFLWQSYALTNALEKCGVGDRVKIVYKGQRDFTGEKGAQRVNVFEVFKSTGQQAIPAPDLGDDASHLDDV